MNRTQVHNKSQLESLSERPCAIGSPRHTSGQVSASGGVERRKCRRWGLDIPVRFVLVSVPEGYIIEEGSARVCNINPSGILVSDIELPSRSLPLKPFQVTLLIEQGSLEKVHMLCSVRWINTNGTISLGLHIDQIPEKHRFRLNEFVKEFENNTIEKE